MCEVKIGVYADIHGKYGLYGGLFFVEGVSIQPNNKEPQVVCHRMSNIEPKVVKIPCDLFLSLDSIPQGLMRLAFECPIGSINRLLPGSCVCYLGHSYKVFGSEYVGWQAFVKMESMDGVSELISPASAISMAQIISTE